LTTHSLKELFFKVKHLPHSFNPVFEGALRPRPVNHGFFHGGKGGQNPPDFFQHPIAQPKRHSTLSCFSPLNLLAISPKAKLYFSSTEATKSLATL